jgi:DNA-binding MarR family transcriptional regulator
MYCMKNDAPCGSNARAFFALSASTLAGEHPNGRCIGIDDGLARRYLRGMSLSPEQAAREFIALFGAAFLRFHRRAPKRSVWTPQGWAVLQHLEMAGPLTVTEAARHMNRAQSVMSEIIDGLERKGLLARMRDACDRRRALVWLTDQGRAAMASERQVLCGERLGRAFGKMSGDAAANLLCTLHMLVDAAGDASPAEDSTKVTAKETRTKRRIR